MPRLSMVATPIGNLEDISLRALRTLREADYILAEDTRQTSKLLRRYHISKPLLIWHQHSRPSQWQKVKTLLQQGRHLAVVTDAGTPGVADPGNQLVALVRKELPEVPIEPIPGPSALTAAMSVAGLALDEFTFVGWLPHKKGRQKKLKEICASSRPVILFESVHRIVKTLKELSACGRSLVVARELTKVHETIYRGSAEEIVSQLSSQTLKGEFVIIVDRRPDE